MLPPNIGKVDVLNPITRVRKVRKYREDDKEDAEDPEKQESDPKDSLQDDSPEEENRDQYPHIDDYA